jgi:hypothetical protein
MAGSDLDHFPLHTSADVQYFSANSNVVGQVWRPWYRPSGATMLQIILVGAGGGGGDAVAGAASTAAGGGGGGSGGQTIVTIPLMLIPEVLFISLARGNPNNTSTSAAAGFASYVSLAPGNIAATAANNVVAIANAGASGGKSSGATAGPVGTAGALATNATMPVGWAFSKLALAGQAGIIGATTGNGSALTLPTTGLWVTGGTGGGGLPAANNAGGNGGLITGVANFVAVPANIPGGVGGAVTPTAGSAGVAGARRFRDFIYGVGGTGGGGGGVAAGGGSGGAGGNGGDGAPGCGGGGGGGAFTGQSFGVGGRGGGAFCYMIAW